jgi:hypothetical protein
VCVRLASCCDSHESWLQLRRRRTGGKEATRRGLSAHFDTSQGGAYCDCGATATDNASHGLPACTQPVTEAVLDDQRFTQLDKLLDQTSLYSKFLSEQMESLEPTVGDAGGAVGDKRRASGGASGSGSKRAKAECDAAHGTGKSPTREMLPLMTGGEMRSYQVRFIFVHGLLHVGLTNDVTRSSRALPG